MTRGNNRGGRERERYHEEGEIGEREGRTDRVESRGLWDENIPAWDGWRWGGGGGLARAVTGVTVLACRPSLFTDQHT